jgi:Ca-activated chloride channel family protein
MRASSITLFLCSAVLMVPVVFAQNSGEAQDLPAAPSAAKQKANAKPVPAAPQPATSAGQTANPNPQSQAADASHKQPSSDDQGGGQGTPSGSAEDEPGTTIRTTVNEVNVVFTVTDKHGHYVKDMSKQDFKVLDNNRPEPIRSFQNETDLPVEVGLLIDASNSIRDRFKFEQESAIEFMNQTLRPHYDKALVVGFDETPEVTQDFTDNTESLARGIRMLRPGGGTALFDALYFACRDKLLKEQHTGPVRKAIVLLSDGDDNQSHVTREEAIDMAQRAEVIVYTISTNIPGGGSRGDKILERIADATGGRAFVPFQLTDVASAFAEIQTELRSQYALAYTPAEFARDGRYHTIEVLAENRKGLHVRSRRGYYAPAE